VRLKYSDDEPRDESGKWTDGGGGGGGGGSSKPGGGKVPSGFMKGPVGQFINQHGRAVINKVGHALKENQKELLAAAVTISLYHIAGVDFPLDVHDAIHDNVVHFAEGAKISMAQARDHMQRTVNALVALRGHKSMEDDDPVLDALLKLKSVLDNDELWKAKEDAAMPMKPRKGESQSDFMTRCVPEMIGTGDDKRPQDQAVAICMSTWREEHGESKQDDLQPEDDESYDDFMDRCLDSIDDEDVCDMIWENTRASDSEMVVHKTHSSEVNGMEFVLSDETPDRLDDVIMSNGWLLDNFRKNPVALFGHRSDFIVGKWQNIRVVDNQLKGHLKLAPKGASERIDEIRTLVEADILRAVSVGFKAVSHEPRKDSHGVTYTKSDLVEVSLVAVPANPNALAVAKSLKISNSTLSMVFGEHASSTVRRDAMRGENADKRRVARSIGEHAEPRQIEHRKGQPMLLSQRIQEAEKRHLALQEQLEKHLVNVDDDNPNEEDMIKTEDLTAKIEMSSRNIGNLKAIEKQNGSAAEDAERPPGNDLALSRRKDVIRLPDGLTLKRAKKPEPLDYFFRAAVVRAKSRADGHTIDDTRRKIYGDDEATRAVCDLVLKAASAPALTGVAGWAQELVQTVWASFMEVLYPMSVYPKLAAKGLSLTFGPAGKIVIPTRNLTPAISGSFVGEGQPIPVRQGAFASQTVVPKKMAVITTWTHEMDEHSTPAIEGLLRAAILEDTAIAMDTLLLDTNAATSVRPPGLRSYQTALTANAATGVGAGYVNFTADYMALYGQLLTLTNGNVRSPTLIVNPQQGLSLSMLQPAAAAAPLYPFMGMVDAGRVLKADLIESSTVPAGTAIMVDAADFVAVGQEGPRLEISDQATLHMEDTTPLDIVSGTGTVGTPAWPTKSMWQTDSLALRLIMFVNWIMRRPVSSWMTGVVWKG
jgi:HK97 family phage prohead protease/HK97 family phage major capsid protein